MPALRLRYTPESSDARSHTEYHRPPGSFRVQTMLPSAAYLRMNDL